MDNKFSWILPSSFRCKEKRDFEIDLTSFFKTIFSKDEIWKRKVSYDKLFHHDKESVSKIESVKFRVYPFGTYHLYLNGDLYKILRENIGIVAPEHLYILDRANFRHVKSITVVEITFTGSYKYPRNLTLEEEKDRITVLENIQEDYSSLYYQLISLANEMISFFLLGLHIAYPTMNAGLEGERQPSGGLVAFQGSQTYIVDSHSDILSFPLLLESARLPSLMKIYQLLTEVWHKDIWTFHRFLKAVRSDHMTIDNYLDLVFALESMFDKNTATETMRLTCALIVGKDEAQAKKINKLIETAFYIRNQVAHGGVHYRLYDRTPPSNKGNQPLILEQFWELKNLVIELMWQGVVKLIADKNPIKQASIRFNNDDIIRHFYRKSVS